MNLHYMMQINGTCYLVTGPERDRLKNWLHKADTKETGHPTFVLEALAFNEFSKSQVHIRRPDVGDPILTALYMKDRVGIHLIPMDPGQD
jgi:hypothetical protein